MSGIFLLKIVFGFLLFTLYYFYYGNNRFTSDAFRFFDDSLVIYSTLFRNPSHYFRLLFGIGLDQPEMQGYLNQMNFWTKDFTHGLFNDNQTIIRFNAVFNILSFGSYHVHTVFMSFLSLIGLAAMFKTFSSYVGRLKPLLFMGVFLVPSTLFWGSGVLKEGIVLFALGLAIWSTFKLTHKASLQNIAVFIGAVILLLYIKVYIIIALTPAIIGFLILSRFTKWSATVVYSCIITVGILTTLTAHNKVDSIDIVAKLSHKQFDFINLANASKAGSAFEMDYLNNEPIAFIQAIPSALLNATFRPFIWETRNPLMLVNSLENMLLFGVAIFCLFHRKRKGAISLQTIGFCMVYILLLYLFIGWTTPISGAIVRYKIPAWPLFVALFLLLSDDKKIVKRIPLLETLNTKLS